MNSRRIDILTNHGILVLSEAERSLLMSMLGESLDLRVAINSDESMESLNLYNKMKIKEAADTTVDQLYKKPTQEPKSDVKKPKKPAKRKRNDGRSKKPDAK